MVSYAGYLKGLDLDQLHSLDDMVKSRIQHKQSQKLKEYLVVADTDINYAFFDRHDYEGAKTRLDKEFVKDPDYFVTNAFRIEVQRWRPDEIDSEVVR